MFAVVSYCDGEDAVLTPPMEAYFLSFRAGQTKEAVAQFLGDGVPRFRFEVVETLKIGESQVSEIFNRLWREGRVLRSRERLTVSYLDAAPGKGKFWRKLTAYLWIAKGSPAILPSGLVDFAAKKTERYTLENSFQTKNVAFIEYSAEATKKQEKKISQDVVIEFMKARNTGVVAREVAEHFEADQTRASNIMEKLRKKGLVEKRGHYNRSLDRETPFRGEIQGYVFGLAGTDQAERRVKQGDGLYSPHIKTVLVEVQKDSKQKRFSSYIKFTESIGEHETLKAMRILTEIYPNLVPLNIGGLGFIYDKTCFSPEEIERETQVCQDRVSHQKRLTGTVGIFHEAFAQHGVDLALRKLTTKVTFWRRVTKGKEHYNIILSNGKEIDRILQIDFLHGKQALWTHYYPIECKYYRGGARPEHVQEFVDKLRRSMEFGEEVNVQEGNQTLRVHLVKQNAYPMLISPFFKKETYQIANKLHVTLVPTWLLGQMASEQVGHKLEVKKLFDEYLKAGGEIEAFMAQAFALPTRKSKLKPPITS